MLPLDRPFVDLPGWNPPLRLPDYAAESLPEKHLFELGFRDDTGGRLKVPELPAASRPGEDSFALRFVVEINPPDPTHLLECEGCRADNRVTLADQDFVTVPPLVIQPNFVEHTVTDRDGRQVTHPRPTKRDFRAVKRVVHIMLPVGDFGRGLNILPQIAVEWHGLL